MNALTYVVVESDSRSPKTMLPIRSFQREGAAKSFAKDLGVKPNKTYTFVALLPSDAEKAFQRGYLPAEETEKK